MNPQVPEKVAEAVEAYVVREFAKIGTRNTLTFEAPDKADAWRGDYKDSNYKAAMRATEVRLPLCSSSHNRKNMLMADAF